MLTYGGVEENLNVFLTSELDGERSASSSGRFIPEERTQFPLDRRLGGPLSRSGRRGEERDPALPRTEPHGRDEKCVQNFGW
jgi:hypothetical protein